MAGVIKPIMEKVWAANIDDISDSGLYRLLGSSVTGIPTGCSIAASFVEVFVYDNNAIRQNFYDRYGSVYTRVKNSGSWGSWRSIDLL